MSSHIRDHICYPLQIPLFLLLLDVRALLRALTLRDHAFSSSSSASMHIPSYLLRALTLRGRAFSSSSSNLLSPSSFCFELCLEYRLPSSWPGHPPSSSALLRIGTSMLQASICILHFCQLHFGLDAFIQLVGAPYHHCTSALSFDCIHLSCR